MNPMMTLLAALALAASLPAWADVPEPLPAAHAAHAARGGFFVIPDRPLAYSFSDICELGIEPRRATSPRGAADGPATGLVAAWARTEKARFAAVGPDTETNGERKPFAPAADRPPFRFADERPATPAADRPLLFASLPEPPPWMQLCGFAIIVLIARRRRDWSLPRGLALGHPSPLRPRRQESSR